MEATGSMEATGNNERISSTNIVNIAILPSPGMGHLNPVLEFVKRLIQIVDDPQRLSISFILVPASPSDTNVLQAKATSFLSTLPKGSSHVDFHTLPIPKFDKEDFTSITEQVLHEIVLNAECSLSSIRSLLVDLTATKKRPFSSIIVDMFGTPAFDVAFELGIKPYVFFPSSVTCLSLFMHLPRLDETVSSDIQFCEMAEPVKLPGCRLPIYGRDFPSAALDRKASYYRRFIRIINKYWLAKGIIVNSFESFEAGVITALRQQPDDDDAKAPKPTLYPIGPVTKKDDDVDDADRHISYKCLRWLDEQLPESVLYINFGSGGTLSIVQVHELALGLELSGQKFLWVVRVPNDDISFGAYLGADRNKDPLDYLPQGFLERTQGRVGLVVPSWAPQARILAHKSTGGFMSHCGWNSILEAVTNGVPFIVWPLYAEQIMNAQFLEKELEVALRVKKPDELAGGGVIGREVIAAAAKDLIAGEQGKEMATKIKGFRDKAEKAIGIDGSSAIALRQLAINLFNSVS